MSRGTPDSAPCDLLPHKGLSPALAGLPRLVLLSFSHFPAVHTPPRTRSGLGSSSFARRYFRNRVFFLFLRLLRCFSSPGSLRTPMDSVHGAGVFPRRVSPFRHLRITACLRLPTAFRSLLRLSSALSAKASTLCSFLLNQLLMYSVTPASFWLVLFSHSSNGCCLFVSFFGHVFPHNPSDVFEVPSGAFSFLFPFGSFFRYSFQYVVFKVRAVSF